MNTNPDPARRGKIARLPVELRNELNLRLRNNEPGKKLVAWLNGLPQMQAIIAQPEFGGEAVTGQNLSEWRRGGYQDWKRREERLETWQKKSKLALEATGGDADEAANVIVALDVADVMKNFDIKPLKDLLREKPEKFLDLMHAWAAVQKSATTKKAAAVAEAQGAQRLDQGERKLDLDERALLLKQTTAAGNALDILNDKRAMEIAASNDSRPVKMERLVQLMFGERPATPTGPPTGGGEK